MFVHQSFLFHSHRRNTHLSPWDRNHPEYGREGYLTYYRNQLKELFTNYGPVTEMWFDGANGGDGSQKRNTVMLTGPQIFMNLITLIGFPIFNHSCKNLVIFD